MDQTNVLPFAARKELPKQASPAARMNNLMSVCGFRTQAELINNAITMLEWAVETVQRGNQVAAFNEASKSYEVVDMPVLQKVAAGMSARAPK